MCGLGWKSLGVLELTALPSIKEEYWVPAVQEVDALLVWGGSPLYLCYWMRQSGLADLLPSLRPETVYVGTSGGAMVATPDFGGETYDDSEPLTGSDRALGLVDFSLFPHLEREDMPDTSLANIEKWAAGCRCLRTRSTIRPPSRWSTEPSKSSPRGIGSCSTRRSLA
jgi:dipeptidase E